MLFSKVHDVLSLVLIFRHYNSRLSDIRHFSYLCKMDQVGGGSACEYIRVFTILLEEDKVFIFLFCASKIAPIELLFFTILFICNNNVFSIITELEAISAGDCFEKTICPFRIGVVEEYFFFFLGYADNLNH